MGDRERQADRRARRHARKRLCDELEHTKDAKKLVARGAKTVLLIEKGPQWFDEDHTGDPDLYDETLLVGLREGQDPKTVAEEQGAHKWRVIPTD